MGYNVVLVSQNREGRRKISPRGWAETRAEAAQIKDRWSKQYDGYYRVLSDKQLKELEEELEAEKLARRREGAQKGAKTRKERGGQAFVLCPTCNKKSKKLYTEMGGLETRRCQGGHMFEYDRWLAQRAFWGPILGRGPVPLSSIKRPK